MLVAPEHVEPSLRWLQARGYRRFDAETHIPWAEKHALQLVRGVLSVDLHWSFHGVHAAPAVVHAVLLRDAAPVQVGGSEVLVPCRAALALLCLLHDWAWDPPLAQPGQDVRRALAVLQPPEWLQVAALAREVDAEAALASSLRRHAPALLLQLGLDAAESASSRLRGSRTPTALGWQGFIQLPTVRARAGYLLRKLLPTPTFMRRRYALARRGLIGLIGSYVERAVLLLVHAPRGLLALRSANRRRMAGRTDGGRR